MAAALFTLAALAISSHGSASSYSGSGDWVVAGTEVVTGEIFTVSGNISVGPSGDLKLVNSTVEVDRNITLTGRIQLQNSTVRFTVDGPGTNYIAGGPGARFMAYDGGDQNTTADSSLITTDGLPFNASFAGNTVLFILHSRVENAGWSAGPGLGQQPGFDFDGALISIERVEFVSGFEALSIRNVTLAAIMNSSFDGFASAINITGGSQHWIQNVTLSNCTYGIRIRSASTFWVNNTHATPGAIIDYTPPGAPPRGTAVTIENSSDFEITNLTLVGTPGAPLPRFFSGFFVRNSSNVLVASFTGNWGDAPGRVAASVNVTLRLFQAEHFDQPLDISSCTDVTLIDYLGTDERSGIQFRATTNIAVRGAVGRNLLVPFLDIGANIGSISLVGAEAYDSIALATIGGNATAFSLQNLTMANVSYGLLVSLTDTAAPSISGVRASEVARDLIDITFQNVTDFFATDLDSDVVGGILFNFTAANASHLTFARFTTNATNETLLRISAVQVNNLAIFDFEANLHLSALVQVETNATADVDIRRLHSTNSSAILVLIYGGSIERASIRDLSLLIGDQPPATGPPASVVLDATGQGGAHAVGTSFSATVDGFEANLSNRGAVYAEFEGPGSLAVANMSLYSLNLDGVQVVSDGSAWALSITNITFLASNATAVHLFQVDGPSVRFVTAEAETAVEFEFVTNGLVENVWHTGAYTALLLVECTDIVGRFLSSVGGFGVDASGSSRLRLTGLTMRADIWAVRVSSSTDVTVDGLTATDTGGGVAYLGVTRGELANASLQFKGAGIQVSQGSSAVTLRSVTASTPAAAVAGVFLQISFGTSVSASSIAFSGRCTRAAQVEYSTGVTFNQFAATGCDEGVVLATVSFVNVTDLWIASTLSGSALTVSDSTDVRIVGANLRDAADTAIFASDVDRFVLAEVDVSNAGADGALFLYLANTTVDGFVADGAAGACLRVLYSPKNVTISNVSARRGLDGVEVIASPGLVFANVNASQNVGWGIFTDILSPGVVLRNITAANNLWNGIVVSSNLTRLIDGNVSNNGLPGISSTPGVRLDWVIEGKASLTDERMDLTGDLTLMPGATLTITRSNLTIEQTVRRRAFEPYTLISIRESATLALGSSALSGRDSRTPYSIEVRTGGHFHALQSLVTGSSSHDATSSINGTGAVFLAIASDFLGWYAPLNSDGGSFTCSNCTFRLNTNGPAFRATTVTLDTFSSFDNEQNGLTAFGSPLVTCTGSFVWFNGAFGAVFDSVPYLQLVDFEALSNALGGIRITNSNLTAVDLRITGPSGPGLVVEGGETTSIAGLSSQANPGTGARFSDIADVNLSALDILNNGASGVELDRVGRARITDGHISTSALFGLHAVASPDVFVERVSFDGDVGSAVRAETGTVITVANASVLAAADYAVVLIGDAQATLLNLTLNATLSGLLATDDSSAFVLNSTTRPPSVLSAAVVRIGWFLRVLVQAPDGFPAPGTWVRVSNATNATVANVSSAAGGATPLIPVIEKAVFANGRSEWFGPQEVAAGHATFGRARTSLNITRYTALGLRLDNVTPVTTPTLDGPAGQGGWFVGPVTVTFAALDDRPAGVTLFWRVGAGTWTEASTDGLTASGFVPIGSEGRAQVEFYAVDAAGNTEGVHAIEVPIDLLAPTASFSALDPVVLGSPVPLSWSGSDGAGSGVVSFDVDYSFEGSAFQPWLNATALRQGGFIGAEGPHQFRVVARDAAGHISAPAFLTVTSQIFGTLRLKVVDAAGAAVSGVTVTVEALNLSRSGTGDIELTGLLPGNYTARITAPGFEPRLVEVSVTAGGVQDLGAVELARAPSSGGFDLTAGYLVLAALVALTAAYYLRMRQRWDQKRRAREREEKAARDEQKAKRRKPPRSGGPLQAKAVEKGADGGDGRGPDGDERK